MVALLVPAILSWIPWIAIWIALGGNITSAEKNIEGFGSAITSGPVSTATNAWIKVAAIAAGLGIGVWLLETKIAKGMGQELAAPPVESIHVASPPTFGTSGGYSYSRGGFSTSSNVNTGGGGGGGGGYGTPGQRVAPQMPRKPRPRRSIAGVPTQSDGFQEAA